MTTDSMLPIAPCINEYTPKTKVVSIPFCGSANLMEDITVLDGEVTKETVLNLYLQAGVYVTTPEPVDKNQCKTVVLHAAKAINPSVQDSNNIPRYEIKKNKTVADMPYFVEYILGREFMTDKRSLLLLASVSEEIDDEIDEDIDDDGYSHNAYTYHCSVLMDSPAILEHKDTAISYPLDTATLREILRKNTYVDAENSDDVIEGFLPCVWHELDKLVDDILSGESQATSIAIYNPENGLLKLNLPVVQSPESNTRISNILTTISESPDGEEMLSEGWIQNSNFFDVGTARFAFNSIIESLVPDVSSDELTIIDDVYFSNHSQDTPLEPASPLPEKTPKGKVPEFVIEGCTIEKSTDDTYKDMPEFRTYLEKDNLIVEYIQHFLRCSGGYPVYKYLACMVGLSTISDRKIVVKHNFATTYPNICAFIIGQSAITHKSTAVNELRYDVLPNVFNCNIISEYSKEGLLDALSENSHACLVNDEIGGMLEEVHNKRGYMSAIPDALCNIFDCNSRYTRRLRKENIEIFDTFATCLWSTTPSRFKETCTARDVESGFLARELFGVPSGYKIGTPMQGRSEEDDTGLNHIIDRFKEIQNLMASIVNLRLVVDDEAYAPHQSWFDAKTADVSNEVQLAVVGRLSTYVFKIAVVYYMGSRSFIKDVESAKEKQGLSITLKLPNIYLSKAMQVVQNYFFNAEMTLFSDSSKHAPDSLTTRVLNKIKSAPNMIISRGELHAALGGRVTKTDLDEVLTLLAASGVIASSKVAKFNGKREGRYFTYYFRYIGEGVHVNDLKYVADSPQNIENGEESYTSNTIYVDKDGNVVKDAEKRIRANELAEAKRLEKLKKEAEKRGAKLSKK